MVRVSWLNEKSNVWTSWKSMQAPVIGHGWPVVHMGGAPCVCCRDQGLKSSAQLRVSGDYSTSNSSRKNQNWYQNRRVGLSAFFFWNWAASVSDPCLARTAYTLDFSK